MPQRTKEEASAYHREWRKKNKERNSSNGKKYYLENKEKIKEKRGVYYLENKEEVLKHTREYKKQHEEWYKEYMKEYNQSPKGKRSMTISSWKRMGIKCDNYDTLYENYLNETHCDFCRVKFGKIGDGTGSYKCCDHDHETGLFRNFLCSKCNIKRGK